VPLGKIENRPWAEEMIGQIQKRSKEDVDYVLVLILILSIALLGSD